MRLSAVKELKAEIESLRVHIKTLRLSANNITSRLDGLPSSKATTSRVESLAVKITDCERRLAELQIELVDKAVELSEEICRRDLGASGEVLIMHYIGGVTFAEIASALSYSRSYVFRLHKRGKLEFERSNDDDKDCC